MLELIGTALAQDIAEAPLSDADKFKGLVALGAILAVGGAAEVYSQYSNRSRAAKSRDWPRVQGTVLAHRMRRPMLSGFGRYVPLVRYGFTVDGQALEHDAVMFGGHAPVKRDEAEAVLRRYPIGATVNVIHDPKNPRLCALESAAAAGNSLLNGIAMAAIGLVLLAAAFVG